MAYEPHLITETNFGLWKENTSPTEQDDLDVCLQEVVDILKMRWATQFTEKKQIANTEKGLQKSGRDSWSYSWFDS